MFILDSELITFRFTPIKISLFYSNHDDEPDVSDSCATPDMSKPEQVKKPMSPYAIDNSLELNKIHTNLSKSVSVPSLYKDSPPVIVIVDSGPKKSETIASTLVLGTSSGDAQSTKQAPKPFLFSLREKFEEKIKEKRETFEDEALNLSHRPSSKKNSRYEVIINENPFGKNSDFLEPNSSFRDELVDPNLVWSPFDPSPSMSKGYSERSVQDLEEKDRKIDGLKVEN